MRHKNKAEDEISSSENDPGEVSKSQQAYSPRFKHGSKSVCYPYVFDWVQYQAL